MNYWPQDNDGKWICMVCSGKMEDGYEPPLCCDGYECGCQGQPTEPNVCTNECWESMIKTQEDNAKNQTK